jgi:hypothetical protein
VAGFIIIIFGGFGCCDKKRKKVSYLKANSVRVIKQHSNDKRKAKDVVSEYLIVLFIAVDSKMQ